MIKKKTYSTLFFDLDGTLWDFSRNSREALRELISLFNLSSKITDFQIFEEKYRKINERLWFDYREGKIEKAKLRWYRFYLAFREFGIEDQDLAYQFGEEYLMLSERKSALMPECTETIDYLKDKYQLFVITNGFEEIQHNKLVNSGLADSIKGLICSERVGVQKPGKEIFEYALTMANVYPSDCLMIGDEIETDIKGALNAGIDQVFYNYTCKTYYFPGLCEIRNLGELMKLL